MNTQPPLEDINAVVNRFQAWVGVQAPAHAKDGVRELTYDEAIRSRQNRISPDMPAPEAEKPASASSPNARQVRTEKSAAPKKRIAARNRSKHTPEDVQRPRAAAPAAALEPVAFRQVLADKLSILPASSSQELAVGQRRRTALSLRVSSSEHALLKKRATEANLSVSCYLRNCVFEVESLRAQLARTLTEERPIQMQPPAGAFIFASWTRFVRRLLFGKTTTLAIRV